MSDLFHEGGHTLQYDEIWGTWHGTGRQKEIHEARRLMLDLPEEPTDEDSARAAASYLSLGRECAAEMLRYAVGCWRDSALYKKVFLTTYHTLRLESYSRQKREGQQSQLAESVPPPLAALVESCVKLLCIEAVVEGKGGSDEIYSTAHVARSLGDVMPYCPELASIAAATDADADENATKFFEYVARCFEMTHRLLYPTLSRLWVKLTGAFAQWDKEGPATDLHVCDKALRQGKAVMADGTKPMFPAILCKAMLAISYEKLVPECILLPRKRHVEGIDYGRLRESVLAAAPLVLDTFLDRKLGSFFYATPSSRGEYFRRRAALFASLWDCSVRAKQEKLLKLVDDVAAERRAKEPTEPDAES